jgi:hypothetical protein
MNKFTPEFIASQRAALDKFSKYYSDQNGEVDKFNPITTDYHLAKSNYPDALDEIERLQGCIKNGNTKNIFYVRYKWYTNECNWLDFKPVRVKAISAKSAAETLKDCNPATFWGDMSFMVSTAENMAGLIYHISELD